MVCYTILFMSCIFHTFMDVIIMSSSNSSAIATHKKRGLMSLLLSISMVCFLLCGKLAFIVLLLVHKGTI